MDFESILENRSSATSIVKHYRFYYFEYVHLAHDHIHKFTHSKNFHVAHTIRSHINVSLRNNISCTRCFIGRDPTPEYTVCDRRSSHALCDSSMCVAIFSVNPPGRTNA